MSEPSPVTNVLQSGVRFRAYPDDALAEVLRRWIGCQRVIYNAKVEEDRLFASQRRLVLRDDPHAVVQTPLDQAYSQFKDDDLTPWLSETPSQILRNGAVRWRDAKDRQLKGLSKTPRRRNRTNFTTVLVTSELFRFVQQVNKKTNKLEVMIELGTASKPVGVLPFRAHRSYGFPKIITVSVRANRWFVSFNYSHAPKDDIILRQPHELAYELDQLSDEDLRATTLGCDRNVRDNILAASNGQTYGLSPVQVERLERKAVRRKRYQKAQARGVKGSKNSWKRKTTIARTFDYGNNVRTDVSHKVSHALANGPERLIAFEKLNIKGMTRRPAAKQDENGTYLPNGARAKAGLTSKILGSCWGTIQAQTTYKALRQNKLVVTVDPKHTSQECSQCEHIHPDNRQGAVFRCLACGYTTHADDNAAQVIVKRAIQALRAGVYGKAKPTKRVSQYKRKGLRDTTGGQPAHVCGADASPTEGADPTQPEATRDEAEIF